MIMSLSGQNDPQLLDSQWELGSRFEMSGEVKTLLVFSTLLFGVREKY